MAGARLRSLLKSATVYEAENRGRSLVASPPNTRLQMRCKSTGGYQWQMVLRDNACPSCLGITRSCTTGKAEAQNQERGGSLLGRRACDHLEPLTEIYGRYSSQQAKESAR